MNGQPGVGVELVVDVDDGSTDDDERNQAFLLRALEQTVDRRRG